MKWIKHSSVAWTHDNLGFFYCKYDAPESLKKNNAEQNAGKETDANRNQKVYYHKLGTPQKDDVLIYEDPKNPKHSYSVGVTHDGKYLLMGTKASTDKKGLKHYADISNLHDIKGKIEFTPIID